MSFLKDKRLDRGKTQQEVAEACGIEQNTYSDIENGKKGTKPETMMKIAKFLDFKWSDYYEQEVSDDEERV